VLMFFCFFVFLFFFQWLCCVVVWCKAYFCLFWLCDASEPYLEIVTAC
jgi:hypothetical protein